MERSNPAEYLEEIILKFKMEKHLKIKGLEIFGLVSFFSRYVEKPWMYKTGFGCIRGVVCTSRSKLLHPDLLRPPDEPEPTPSEMDCPSFQKGTRGARLVYI